MGNKSTRKSFIFTCVVLSYMLMMLSCASRHALVVEEYHSAPTIPRYDIFELFFEHNGTYENNFDDVAINVVFTSPSGIQYDVKGFYYADDLWKVRFRPDEIGRWTYVYAMTGKGELLKRGDGFFECTISGYEGPVLRNPENPYRFVFASGKPYYPVGLQDCFYADGSRLLDIPLDELHEPKLVSADKFLFIYGQAGFNLLRFSQKNCSYDLYDDLAHFREDKSIATDYLLSSALRQGFRIMFGFFGFHDTRLNVWEELNVITADDHETVDKEKRFIDYCIARWGVYVDFWELLNERDATDEWTTVMADHVRSVDPYQKPISTSWERPDLPVIDINSPHWYESENILQSDFRVQQLAALWKKSGKPVIVSEQGNSGSNWDPLSGERMRIRTWTALFQETSFVFWHTGIVYKNDEAANIYIGPEERGYIRVLQNFSSKLDSEVRMVPVEVSSPDRVRAYGLESNSVAAAYLHHFEDHDSLINDIKITLDIPSADNANDELILEWIDPSTGNVLSSVYVQSGLQTLDVPAFSIDLALLITSL